MFSRHEGFVIEFEDHASLSQSPWASARACRRLDSELAIQLRIILRSDFEQSQSWRDLRRWLRKRGFSLKLKQGRLRLIDSLSRVDICSTGFLGFPLSALEQKFGAQMETVDGCAWLVG